MKKASSLLRIRASLAFDAPRVTRPRPHLLPLVHGRSSSGIINFTVDSDVPRRLTVCRCINGFAAPHRWPARKERLKRASPVVRAGADRSLRLVKRPSIDSNGVYRAPSPSKESRRTWHTNATRGHNSLSLSACSPACVSRAPNVRNERSVRFL